MGDERVSSGGFAFTLGFPLCCCWLRFCGKDEPLAGAADGLEDKPSGSQDKSPGSQNGIAMRRMLTGVVPYLLLLLLSLLVGCFSSPLWIDSDRDGGGCLCGKCRLYRSLDWFLLLTFLVLFYLYRKYEGGFRRSAIF